MISVPNALTAGQVAQEITATNNLIAELNTLITDGGYITTGNLTGYDPVTGLFFCADQSMHRSGISRGIQQHAGDSQCQIDGLELDPFRSLR